jgi:hypothetical protein
MIIVDIIIAIGMIVFGFLIYPSFVTYFIDPMYAAALAVNPSMNVLEQGFFKLLPLIVLLFILYSAIIRVIHRNIGGGNNPNE